MKLAMYKGPAKSWHYRVSHWFTCLWTRSDYSHCELVFEGQDLYGESLCASSSGRDGGVRWARINLGSGHWDVYPVTVTAEQEAAAHLWFSQNAGDPYDWLGLLWFVLPIRAFDQPSRYFCSESIAAALGLERPHKYHPQKLLEALQ